MFQTPSSEDEHSAESSSEEQETTEEDNASNARGTKRKISNRGDKNQILIRCFNFLYVRNNDMKDYDFFFKYLANLLNIRKGTDLGTIRGSFQKSFDDWKKNKCNFTYLPILVVSKKIIDSKVYVICMSLNDKLMYIHEGGRVFPFDENEGDAINSFVVARIDELNERFRNFLISLKKLIMSSQTKLLPWMLKIR